MEMQILLTHGVYLNSSQKWAMVRFSSFALLTFLAPLRAEAMPNQGYVQAITSSIHNKLKLLLKDDTYLAKTTTQ
jgi:hypothetical protein